MQKFFSALVALMLAASFGAAYAAPTQGGYVSGDQHQDAPKDCKKDPNDPRCKGGN